PGHDGSMCTLHANSPRSEEAFVDLNCAGLSRDLLETELFGHEKGAFTSATSSKQGLFEVAHRGTIFLDEIGDVDVQIQPKLLKVLEDKRFRRVGDIRDRQVVLGERPLDRVQHATPQAVAQDRERAERKVRAGLLFGAIARAENIEVQEADVEAKLRELAERSGKHIAKVRADYQGEQRRTMELQVLEKKLLEYLVSLS
ncbi:hypothetical protein B4Q13_21270, partial [Lacticaseibacillus rhamnosus]